ncbi:MAG TPA: TetR/AcrR family transcriptional regulator [Reyranella sp.]|nr:TetR/AcrR family transcriptional regulator [Reyranella sp.]
MAGFSTAAASPRKRRGEGHTRRDEILQAAKKLFLQEGYEATTIRKIADRVGVSAPALYLYFADKEAIMVALCDQTFGFLIDKIGEIEQQPLGPREQLRRCGEAYIRFGLEHPQEYWLTFMSGNTPKQIKSQGGHRARNPEAGQPGTTGAIAFQHVVDLLKNVEAAGIKLNYGPETAAELLWMGLHGLVAALINNPEFEWSNREELIGGMLDLVTKGVLSD